MAHLQLPQTSFNRTLIFAGFFFLLCGIVATLYFYFIEPRIKDGWEIKISGTQEKQALRIKKNILFFISKSARVTAKEIAQSLELDPIIRQASVKLKPGKLIQVRLVMNQIVFLYSNQGKLQEFDDTYTILQDDSLGYAHHIPTEFPIISINKKLIHQSTALRKIFRIYKKTKKSLSFLWQRISEIVLTKNKTGENKILLYPTVARCQISFTLAINIDLLKRVWSIIYYFEKIASEEEKRSFKVIELNKNNAIIRSREV